MTKITCSERFNARLVAEDKNEENYTSVSHPEVLHPLGVLKSILVSDCYFLETRPMNQEAMHICYILEKRPLDHIVFKLFCEEIGREHQLLLFHTEVRCLSYGNIQTRTAVH